MQPQATNNTRCKTDQSTDRSWTGRALIKAVAMAVRILQSNSNKLERGDVVVFYCNQSEWHVIWLLAVSILGGVYSGNTDSYPYDEFAHLAKSSNAKFIVASENSLEKANKFAAENASRLKALFKLIPQHETGPIDDKRSLLHLMREQKEFFALHSCREWQQDYQFIFHLAGRIEPERDFFVINFSSGTTGKPKAVGRTHSQYLVILNLGHESIALGGSEIVFSAHSHFGHVGAMSCFIYPLMVAGSVVLTRSEPETWLIAVSKYKITNAFFVPSSIIVITRFANDSANRHFIRQHDFSSLKDILIAGEFLPLEMSDQFLRTFPSVSKYRQSFGSTEMAFVTCVPRAQANIGNALYSGIPVAGVSFKIVPFNEEDTGRGQSTWPAPALAPLQIGEVLVKSHSVSRYLNNESANAEAFDPEGFFRTGDGGYYDHRGFLLITDRFKSIIKVEGFQVSPTELEDILLSHPSVREVVVIGIPHQTLGHVPRAFVVPEEPLSGVVYDSEGRRLDHKEGVMSCTQCEAWIQSYVAERVAAHKTLRGGIKFFTRFPVTILGKVDRKFLKGRFSSPE